MISCVAALGVVSLICSLLVIAAAMRSAQISRRDDA
jgi:hypothetical protein